MSIPPAGVASTLALSSWAEAPRAYATSDEAAIESPAAAPESSGVSEGNLSPPSSTTSTMAARTTAATTPGGSKRPTSTAERVSGPTSGSSSRPQPGHLVAMLRARFPHWLHCL
jgi:hypothetical protein